MAAVRETREEIGVEVDLIDLIGIYTIGRGDNSSGIGFVFRGRIVGGLIKPAKGEISDWDYFTKNQIEEMFQRDEIYKPEYNSRCIKDWVARASYPLDVVKPLR